MSRPVGSGSFGLVPFREIGLKMKMPSRTVSWVCARALKKLRKQPGVIDWLQAVAEEKQTLRASSVECQKDFVETYGE